MARAKPRTVFTGSCDFSKRMEASVRNFTLVDVLRIDEAWKLALSSSSRVVVAVMDDGPPPMTPARATGPAASAIVAAVPAVVDAFYAWASAAPETAPLLPPPTIGPLKRQVLAYWQELATASFDRPYAASRSRLGVVHERVGLSLQLYVVGVAQQVGALLGRVVPAAADPPALARAVIRALFFDLSFVVDAYLDARAAALLRADGYAAALLAGLPQGVAVVDADSLWIDSANPALLTMFGLDARLVRGVHVEALVPLPGIAAWLARFAAGHEPRVVAVLAAGPRQFRATAVRLADADAGSRSRIALDPDVAGGLLVEPEWSADD